MGAWDRDGELYERQRATLVASFLAYAAHSPGAAVLEGDGVAVCLFPSEPARGVYNNAVLDRGLGPDGRSTAIEAMEMAYRSAGIDRYAAWAHEAEPELAAALLDRGYRFETATRAMAIDLDRLLPRPSALDLVELDWDAYTRILELPGLLAGADPAEFHLRVARLDGEVVGTAIAYDHEGDCGIFNLGTLAAARRRGIGTALTALQLHDAYDRGCTTASLQSTPIAEGLYTALGFRGLGRYLEYVPGT